VALDSISAATRRSFWQRRVRDPIVAQLTQGITPEKIALTIAVGSALALFPMLGVTTLLCFVAGIVLGLNQPIIQAVNYLCFPAHFAAIYTCWLWGDRLFGTTNSTLPVRKTAELMWRLLWDDPTQLLGRFGGILAHGAMVWALVAPFWVVGMYYGFRSVLREMARVRAEAAEEDAASRAFDPTNHPVP
jgi:uncharacterized protein (DUF2062 family)